jgi:hypothetical protein
MMFASRQMMTAPPNEVHFSESKKTAKMQIIVIIQIGF